MISDNLYESEILYRFYKMFLMLEKIPVYRCEVLDGFNPTVRLAVS